MTYTTLTGVPVFRPGMRRGEHYTPARMRQIVRNSNRMRPYFRGVIKTKLTHGDAQPTLLDQAALGQSVRYYLKPGVGGPFVMADFTGVPEPLAQAAPQHFPNISVEKYRYFEPGDGAQVPDVIKSVAFLGADAPEVKGLKLAYPAIFADGRGEIERFDMGEQTMELGKVIAAWRESLGMAPEDLAGIIGNTPDDIAAIESDATAPDEAALAAIADAFGLTVEDLMAGKMPDEAAPEKSEKNAPPAPKKGAAPAKFAESDVQQLIAAAVAQAVAPFKRQVAQLAVKAQRTETELFAERAQAKQALIAAQVAAWEEKGLPAVCLTGLEAFMAKLDDRNVETFAEGVAQTPLEWFKGFVETFRQVGGVPLGELGGGAFSRAARDDVTQIEQYAEQHKVDFSTAARVLSRQGKLTPKDGD